jgi:two-component system CheB/CheR fusion protein
MTKLREILALVCSINADEFQEQSNGDSLDDVHKELLCWLKNVECKKKRT